MAVITVQCPKCDNTMRFSPDKAGRKAKCANCGTPVAIPAATAAGPPPLSPAMPPPPPPGDEDDGPADYGLVEGENKAPAYEDDDGKAKKKKKKDPKIQRKVKALADKEEWAKVHVGLMFLFIGVCVAFIVHLLHLLYVALGSVEFAEYARGLSRELERRGPIPPPGQLWDVDMLNVLLGMIAGPGFLGFARGALAVCIILTVVQSLLWFVGYGFCFPVPRRFGTFVEVAIAAALGFVNFLLTLGLGLLPVLGAYGLVLIPLLVPEVAMTEYNIERSIPINVLFSRAPFWENFVVLVVKLLIYLEPVVVATFLWSIGMSIKERRIEERGQAVVQLGLGTYFVAVAYQMMSIAGTSGVLVNVLKVLYVTWFAFHALFLVWLAGLLLKTRELLAKKMDPENPLD